MTRVIGTFVARRSDGSNGVSAEQVQPESRSISANRKPPIRARGARAWLVRRPRVRALTG